MKKPLRPITPSELPDKTIDRHSIALYLSTALDIPNREAEVLLNIVWAYILDALVSGKRVKIPRIGSLERVDYVNKPVRNAYAKTNEIKARHSRISFTASRVIKEAINTTESKEPDRSFVYTSAVYPADLMDVLKLREKMGFSVVNSFNNYLSEKEQ